MKTITIISTLFLMNIVFAQKEKMFAKINGNEFNITSSTKKLEKDVADLMFKDQPTSFTVEVRKGYTLGEASEEFFYVLLTDTNSGISVAKWLERRNKKLYITNEFRGNEYLPAYYVSCSGQAACMPQIVIEDHKKYWVCNQETSAEAVTTCTKSIGVFNKL